MGSKGTAFYQDLYKPENYGKYLAWNYWDDYWFNFGFLKGVLCLPWAYFHSKIWIAERIAKKKDEPV
jgi:hypothetical protein